MANAFDQTGTSAHAIATNSRWNLALAKAAEAVPSMLFALRLWAAVCLALFVAFWLELDDPSWAATSALIVCQPQLGTSLRKGWFRVIGTVVGATMIVALTACFPQDRIAFLGLLAFWCGLCAFAATMLRNFASYSAALAGYTAAIIAADTLGATGGPGPGIFMLAVSRATEICIGILCAGVILAGTDLGGAQRRLACSFASLGAEITDRFSCMLALAGTQLPDTQVERRDLVRRVVALDPLVDETIGESSRARYYSSTLQTAMFGLFEALDGWRGVARHLAHLPEDLERERTEAVLRSFPAELRSLRAPGLLDWWTSNPIAMRRLFEEATQTLTALPADTPSLRLLADETAKVMAGMLHVLDGVAMLVDAPGQPSNGARGFRLSAPDWLTAVVSATRVFFAIGVIELFWVATAWPDGAWVMVFVAVVLLLLSPKGDLAYGASVAFALGIIGGLACAAAMEFAVLPTLQTFPAFCCAIGLFIVPVGFALAQSRKPAMIGIFTAMSVGFMLLLSPTNQMSYDPAQFYNLALAIVVGSCIASLTFRLLPPLSPAWRMRRMLSLTLRDLRRLTTTTALPISEDWESRICSRLTALPDQSEPSQRSQLLAALSIGSAIIDLRRILPRLGSTADLDATLAALAQGRSGLVITWLRNLEHRLASVPFSGPEAAISLRARGLILVISEVLIEHGAYFNAGAPA
jgi:uncharacterized membrane protein YccC